MSKINSALPLVIATGPHGLVGKALRASLPDLVPLDVVARLAYPYGGDKTPRDLIEKFLQRFEEAKRSAVALYDDQRICPAYLPDVARGLTRLVEWLASGKGDTPRVFHLVGAATTPFEFGKMLKTVFNCGDVSLRPSSVEGTPYARNLRLSTERTRGALGWSPTPHRAALQRARARRTTGTDADPG